MLGQNIKPAGTANVGVSLPSLYGVERGPRFKIFEAVAGDPDRLACLVQPGTCPADPLPQTLGALVGARLDGAVDIHPITAQVQRDHGDTKGSARGGERE